MNLTCMIAGHRVDSYLSKNKKDPTQPDKQVSTPLSSVVDLDGPDTFVDTLDLFSRNDQVANELSRLPLMTCIKARINKWRDGDFGDRLRFEVVGFELIGQPAAPLREIDDLP